MIIGLAIKGLIIKKKTKTQTHTHTHTKKPK